MLPLFPVLFSGGWWFKGSALDLDFQNNRAAVQGSPTGTATSQLSITRATIGYAQTSGGLWQSFASGVFRITDKGLLVEEARTNSALWARDMTNATWVKVNMTTALTAIGIDGTANVATTLTATAGNATALQAVVDISEADTYSVWLKRISGTGTINISLDGVAWTAVTLTTSYQQFQITSTLLNPNLGIQIVTNGDSIAADFNQLELSKSFATSPILTTSAAVTRNADVVTLTNSALISSALGTWFVEWLDNTGSASQTRDLIRMRTDANNNIEIGINSSNKVQLFVNNAGVTQANLTSTNAPLAGIKYRQTAVYGTNDFSSAYTASLQATVLTDVSGTPPSGVIPIGFGGSPAGGSTVDSYLRRIVWFPSRISDAQTLAWAQGTIGP